MGGLNTNPSELPVSKGGTEFGSGPQEVSKLGGVLAAHVFEANQEGAVQNDALNQNVLFEGQITHYRQDSQEFGDQLRNRVESVKKQEVMSEEDRNSRINSLYENALTQIFNVNKIQGVEISIERARKIGIPEDIIKVGVVNHLHRYSSSDLDSAGINYSERLQTAAGLLELEVDTIKSELKEKVISDTAYNIDRGTKLSSKMYDIILRSAEIYGLVFTEEEITRFMKIHINKIYDEKSFDSSSSSFGSTDDLRNNEKDKIMLQILESNSGQAKAKLNEAKRLDNEREIGIIENMLKYIEGRVASLDNSRKENTTVETVPPVPVAA